MTDDAFDNGEKKPARTFGRPIQPGQVLNPKGRPKGARSKLGEDFVGDALAAWKANGPAALQVMASTDPSKFCTMIASLLPKELNVKTLPAEELTGDELDALVVSVKRLVAAATAGSRADADERTGPETKH